MARSVGRGIKGTGALWRYALTALLGIPVRRPPSPTGDRRRRDPATSSYEAPVEAANELQFGRAYWLPPFGHGNGIEALFWTPLAELPEHRVDPVLRALAEQGIPAWAAASARGRGTSTPARDRPHDLWVGSGQLDEAQDVLMRALAV